MRVLIVEDEPLAADRLESMLRQRLPDFTLVGLFDSVEETVEALQIGLVPDLAFFDIQLADGLSFSIFEQAQLPCPVIFTTAFDQYALQAFEVNSIDYLLKPIAGEKLDRALQKFHQRLPEKNTPVPSLAILQQAMAMIQGKQYKDRFVVKSGATLQAIPVKEIDYFWSENKLTWIRLKDGRKHTVDYNLEQLESLLNPQDYFRVNRKYYVGLPAINKATVYSNSRLKLHLPHLEAGEDVVVSREKVQLFKAWMAGD
jgi:DNA-binding LytR/AlgR family response regulator